MVLRVVLAEDSFLMRDGINALLELDDEVEVVASCEDYDTLLAAVEEHRPDVVLTDIRMPPSQTDEGIRAADVIRSAHPEIGVVVLSQYVEPEYADACSSTARTVGRTSSRSASPTSTNWEVRFAGWPMVDRSSTPRWSKR